MRVFIGLTEVAGYYGNLKRGFESIGVPVYFASLGTNPFGYTGADDGWLVAITRFMVRKRRRAAERGGPGLRLWRLLELGAKGLLFLWAVPRFDVFIFGFASSFFNLRELPLLRRIGKKVVFVFNGSDERPPYLNGALPWEEDADVVRWIRHVRERKRFLRRVAQHADLIVSHNLSAHFHECPYVPFLYMGVPFPDRTRGSENAGAGSSGSPRPVRIVHAPSRPESKGTDLIRSAIVRLRGRGHEIDYIELVNRPNEDVLREIDACDFVVDEVWSDSPMAGLAAEAAFAGKPSIVGGYGWSDLDRELALDDVPPSFICHPDEMEGAIERLIIDADFRRDLGRRARDYVQQCWTPESVASRYLRLLQEGAPPSVVRDPGEIRYVHGYGMPEESVRLRIRDVVRVGGVEALGLEDKPDLRRRLLEFAGVDTRC